MDVPENIRCLSVIAHGEIMHHIESCACYRPISLLVDHGKSTLTDSLLAKAGMVSVEKAGMARITDNRPDEQERGITIKSTAVTMSFELDKSITEDIKQRSNGIYFQ